MRQLAIVSIVLLVACGDDGGSSPPIDAAGTFNFICNPHGFAGSVVVQ